MATLPGSVTGHPAPLSMRRSPSAIQRPTPPTVARLLHSGALGPLMHKADLLARLGKALAEAMPAPLAGRCQVANLQDDATLVVIAASSAVAAKIRALAPRLERSLASVHPGVLTLLVQVRPESLAAVAMPPQPRLLAAEAAGHLDRLAASLPDSSLKTAITRLASKRQSSP